MTTQSLSVSNASNLYERDYHLWLSHTARLIKEGRFSELDAANLIEEIESPFTPAETLNPDYLPED